MRTKAGFAIAILGVIVLVSSIGSLIYGLTHSTVEASVTSSKGEYVVTDAGVIDLVNVKVRVDVTPADKKSTVSLALATSEDAHAWSQKLPVREVTGLKNWTTFATKQLKADGDDKPAVLGSDLWVYEKSGKGTVSFDYKVDAPGNTSLIAYSPEASPLTLTLTWERPGVILERLPYIAIGVLLIAIGIVLTLIGIREGETVANEWFASALALFQRQKKNSQSSNASDIDIDVPSRDELAEHDRDAQRQYTGELFGAGIIPTANGQFRQNTAQFPVAHTLEDTESYGKGDSNEA